MKKLFTILIASVIVMHYNQDECTLLGSGNIYAYIWIYHRK